MVTQPETFMTMMVTTADTVMAKAMATDLRSASPYDPLTIVGGCRESR